MRYQTEKPDRSRLAPTSERPYAIYLGSVFVRALHLLAAGTILGAYLLGAGRENLPTFHAIVALTGGMLVVSEWMGHRELYRQLSGISILTKLILLGLLPIFPDYGAPLVVTAFLFSAITSHLPKKLRCLKFF